MKLLNQLSYETDGKNDEQLSDKELFRSIVVSVISILLCVTCLIGLTWAWFSSSISANVKITAANFDLDIYVLDGDTAVTKNADGYFVLDPSKTYSVQLSKKGTASNGFCHLLVKTPDSESTAYYTENIPCSGSTEGEPYVFSILGIESIKFTPIWGNYPTDQPDKVVLCGDAFMPGILAAIYPDSAPLSQEPENPDPVDSVETTYTEEITSDGPANEENENSTSETDSEITTYTEEITSDDSAKEGTENGSSETDNETVESFENSESELPES